MHGTYICYVIIITRNFNILQNENFFYTYHYFKLLLFNS